MWQGIYGHEQAVERFRQTLAAGRLATTYLLVGPEGVGKRALAERLAKALLCQRRDPAALDPCGGCQSCALADAGTHPDLHIVQRPADSKFLKIEQFVGRRERRHREGLCHDLALRPLASSRRVAIIDDADWFTVESANALLKLLEEPPPGTVVFLIGTSRSRQLPTILSRAQLLRFDPLPTEVVARLALAAGMAADPASAQALAERSGGSLARARDLADPVVDEASARIAAAWRSPTVDLPRLMRDVEEAINAAGKEADARRTRFRQILTLAGERLRATLAAEDADADATLAALERCLDAEEALDRNANQTTLLETWLDGLTAAPSGR